VVAVDEDDFIPFGSSVFSDPVGVENFEVGVSA
jgi:hypothetical protein